MKKIIGIISGILFLPIVLVIMLVVFIFTYIGNLIWPDKNKTKETLESMYNKVIR